jgi:hypothetical protein
VQPGGSTLGHLSFTCVVDGLSHLVSDDAAALGVAVRRGTYTALCGHLVYAAALVSSAGPLCRRCTHAAMMLACRSRPNMAATAVLDVPD